MNTPSDLADLDLTGQEWRALSKLADSLIQFEPLAKRPGVGPTTAERLVVLGLAESGPTGSAFQARGMPLGYRLTQFGWRALEHQMALRSGRRRAAWLGKP